MTYIYNILRRPQYRRLIMKSTLNPYGIVFTQILFVAYSLVIKDVAIKLTKALAHILVSTCYDEIRITLIHNFTFTLIHTTLIHNFTLIHTTLIHNFTLIHTTLIDNFTFSLIHIA